MDILGQLRKLIEITFKSGTHDLTIKGADGTIPGTPAPTQDIEVQIGDGPAVQSMTTDSNTQTFSNKRVDSADNTIRIDSCETESIRIDTAETVDLTINTSDPAVNLTVDSADSNTSFTFDSADSNTSFTFDTSNNNTNFTFNSIDIGAVITLDADETNTIISNIDNDEIKINAGIDATKIHDGSVDNAEFSYLDGVTSSIQEQINNDKQDLLDHESEMTEAHQASAIGYDDTNSDLGGNSLISAPPTNVKTAIEALDTILDNAESEISTNTTNFNEHVSNSDAHDASDITFANANITAGEVQGAIDEVEGRVAAAESNISSNATDISNLQTDKVDTTTQIITSTGQLTGGGNLSGDLTLDVGNNVNLLDTNQVVTGHKTLEVTNLGTGTAINDNASSTLAEPDKTIIPLTGTPTVTDIETLTDTSVASGRIVLLRNDTVATFVIKSTGNIATADDIELAPEAVIMLCYDGTDWDVVGGSGGGGAGGLELATLSSGPITADISTHYLVDTTASAITVNLPDASALSATNQKTATIRFTDSTEQFSTNNLIIVPNTGEQINGFAIDESLIVDVAGAWVEVSWDSATSRWALNTSGGSGGGGGGGLIIEEYAFGSLPTNLVKDRHYLVDFGGGSNLNTSATLPAIGTDVGAIKVTPINNGGGCTITLTADGSDQINDPELGSSTTYIIDVGSATFNSNINDSTWELTDNYWPTAQDAGETLWQERNITADVTSNGVISALTFDNLTIGKTYRVSGSLRLAVNDGAADPQADINVTHDGVVIQSITSFYGSGSVLSIYNNPVCKIFTATATELTFVAANFSADSYLEGNNGNRSYVILEELPQHSETSKWTP